MNNFKIIKSDESSTGYYRLEEFSPDDVINKLQKTLGFFKSSVDETQQNIDSLIKQVPELSQSQVVENTHPIEQLL